MKLHLLRLRLHILAQQGTKIPLEHVLQLRWIAQNLIPASSQTMRLAATELLVEASHCVVLPDSLWDHFVATVVVDSLPEGSDGVRAGICVYLMQVSSVVTLR